MNNENYIRLDDVSPDGFIEDIKDRLINTVVFLSGDDGCWDVSVCDPYSFGRLDIPLSDLVRNAADDATPGVAYAESEENWEELVSLASRLRHLASEIDKRIADKDSSGYVRACVRCGLTPD